jgi:hypothetical protein
MRFMRAPLTKGELLAAEAMRQLRLDLKIRPVTWGELLGIADHTIWNLERKRQPWSRERLGKADGLIRSHLKKASRAVKTVRQLIPKVRPANPGKIRDEFSDLPISRQLKHWRRKRHAEKMGD